MRESEDPTHGAVVSRVPALAPIIVITVQLSESTGVRRAHVGPECIRAARERTIRGLVI